MKRARLRSKLSILIHEHTKGKHITDVTVAIDELEHQINQLKARVAAHAARTLTQSENPCLTSQFVPRTHR